MWGPVYQHVAFCLARRGPLVTHIVSDLMVLTVLCLKHQIQIKTRIQPREEYLYDKFCSFFISQRGQSNVSSDSLDFCLFCVDLWLPSVLYKAYLAHPTFRSSDGFPSQLVHVWRPWIHRRPGCGCLFVFGLLGTAGPRVLVRRKRWGGARTVDGRKSIS